MKVKAAIVLIVLLSIIFIIFSSKSKEIGYETVSRQQVDINTLGIRNYVGLLSEEPNVYFFTKGSEVIMYSNLKKSDFDNYKVADIKMKANKLIVDINGEESQKSKELNEDLIVRIFIDTLPKEVEVKFLGKKITDYKVIEAD